MAALSLGISVEGLDELQDRLDRINPRKNTRWVRRALTRSGLRVQKLAAEEMIKRGGKGPPVPNILT